MTAQFDIFLRKVRISQNFENGSSMKKNPEKFMAHRLTALFRVIFPFKDKTQIQKKLTIGKLFKSGLRMCTKFGQACSNNEQKITLADVAFFIGFLDIIWVTSSAENIDLARKRK